MLENASHRAIPQATPTPREPPWSARSRSLSAPISRDVAFAAVPTWNVNAPWTGWVSAERTRQVTT